MDFSVFDSMSVKDLKSIYKVLNAFNKLPKLVRREMIYKLKIKIKEKENG